MQKTFRIRHSRFGDETSWVETIRYIGQFPELEGVRRTKEYHNVTEASLARLNRFTMFPYNFPGVTLYAAVYEGSVTAILNA